MPENVYIHIPFCKSKCKYCSFISYTDLGLKEQYLTALKNEINLNYRGEKLKTLYIGGGTPSLLTVNEIESLLCLFDTDKNSEITIELNPETVDYDYFLGLRKCGINRISLGCQTFDDKILKIIGRRHNSKQVINAVQLAKKAGFENINLDFIYGLPNQTLEIFENDLNEAVNLGIYHISLYGLKIEEGCYFYKHLPENIADDDMQADMYLKACDIMEQNDFEHYEISNFAKKGLESRHNLNYWNNNTYYGFGVASHGYIDGIRYSNNITIEGYIKKSLYEKHKLTNQERLEEEIFLGFRKASGINSDSINKKFNINFEKKYSKFLTKYIGSGHIKSKNNTYSLTKKGILVSNIIFADFID